MEEKLDEYVLSVYASFPSGEGSYDEAVAWFRENVELPEGAVADIEFSTTWTREVERV